MTRRTVLLGTITAGLAVLFSLALLELVLHLLNWPPAAVSHQRLFVEYDATRGWRNIPNATGRIVADEYEHELAYNERGMRGPVRPYAKPAGTLRVLLVGDSFVDGYTERLGERVGELLEQRIAAASPGRTVEVISLGAGGYSTDQQLLWLREEGLKYEPDVVILMFFANDIWYNRLDRYWRGGKPRFVPEQDSLVLTNVPVPPPDSAPMAPAGPVARVNRFVRAHSKLYWVAARAVQNQPALYGLAVRLGLAEPSPELIFDAGNGQVIPGEFSVFLTDPPPETEEAWRVTESLIQQMERDARAAGADFVAFLVPIRSRIYNREDDVRHNVSRQRMDPDAVTRRFLAHCRRHGLACIDPTAGFVTAAESLLSRGERLYYRYDWHWNRNGHALAARILADSIVPHLSVR